MKNYNIGLDIGTTSVGWAVVDDETSKIVRKGSKNLWGVRLFESAETAESRRIARGNRRRYDRRRKRVKLLQEEFKEEINKVDPLFFDKLKQTFFASDDVENKTINITSEEILRNKEYNKKYPTIFHLRNKLINSEEKEDIRLVYLAIHHIIKYRGNFLYGNEEFSAKNVDIALKLENIFRSIYNSCNEIILNLDNMDYDKFEKILMGENIFDKKILLKKELGLYLSKAFLEEFIKMVIGYKFSVTKMFSIESEEDLKISFRGNDYDEEYDKLTNILREKTEYIDELKELYDMIFLKNLFKGKSTNYISELMVEKYNKHKDDLKILKKLFSNDKKSYYKMFKDSNNKRSIYTDYVKNKLSYEELSKELLKLLEAIPSQNEQINYIKNEVMEEHFLPRITDVDNGKYPYQLNKEELKLIIEKQGKYYPFLLDSIDGKYKIVKILDFKIPYYVGPLNNTTLSKGVVNPNAWIIKKDSKIQITPYNFDQIVDKEATAEAFITRMLSNCTYLLNEKAMPNNSILYSKFKVLNELKQIRINGISLTNEMQKQIFDDLFLKSSGSISETVFINYLRSHNMVKMYNSIDITGYSAEGKFANDMSSYYDFFGSGGFFKDTTYDLNDAEEIIKWVAIFEDRAILETKIKNQYEKLSPNVIKKIVAKKYKGWSSLSKKLLTNKYYFDKNSGEKKSIMDLMEETKYNFMQIISDREYGFQKMIKELNCYENHDKINYSLVSELSTSPSIKKGIYQTLLVVQEIVRYMGKEPNNIIVEMAREDEEKKRTSNKKDYLLKIYDNLKETTQNYNNLKKELKEIEKIDSQKLFLYFVQEGKSLYSGDPLNINNLDEYEIDHIIPQTLIKDDSIDNKALVFRNENQEKGANFVLPQKFRTDSKKVWWEHLKKNNLISSKKFYNLCRSNYSKDDIEGFINRQIVETRQISKHIINIINNFYKETKVIYLNASLSHNYREKFQLYKYRDLNDIHHAHDAYLAAAIGKFQDKYLKKVDFSILKEINKELIEHNDKSNFKYGYVINSMDARCFNTYDEKTGEVEEFDVNELNKTIEKTLYQNDVIISKKVEIRTGEFYNQTKNKKGKSGVSLKDNLPTDKYGSYTSLNPSYAAVVKYTKKNKNFQKMIGIPIYIAAKEISDKNIKDKYIRDLLKLDEKENLEIIKDKIPFFTTLDWNGQICCLVGATDMVEVCNAVQFYIDKENAYKWKNTLNRLFNGKKSDDIEYSNQLDEIIIYIIGKIEKNYKLYSNLVDSIKEIFKDFTLLTIDKKEKSIKEMINLLKYNSKCANLKVINQEASSAFGKKNDRIIEHAVIIDKSVTGIWNKKNEF